MHRRGTIRQKDCVVLCFPLFSNIVRIGYGLMLLSITAASCLVYAEHRYIPVLGILFGGFSLFVLCYVDRWRFNCTAKTAEYSIGFAFFTVTKHYAFSDIEKAETEYFTKGFFKTQFARCLLCLRTGEKKTVAVFPVRRSKRLEQRWQRLTSLLNE